MFQKTIVRYELNDRKYKVDDPTDDFWDKWQFPCFLGMDDNNNLVWYNCCFETIAENGNVHKLFFFENTTFDSNFQKYYFIKDTVRTVVDNLMNLGLIVRNENGKTYKYVFEGYQFEKLTIKELLGIEVECFRDLCQEQFNSLEKKLENIWEKQSKLYEKNKDCFIDFAGIEK